MTMTIENAMVGQQSMTAPAWGRSQIWIVMLQSLFTTINFHQSRHIQVTSCLKSLEDHGHSWSIESGKSVNSFLGCEIQIWKDTESRGSSHICAGYSDGNWCHHYDLGAVGNDEASTIKCNCQWHRTQMYNRSWLYNLLEKCISNTWNIQF